MNIFSNIVLIFFHVCSDIDFFFQLLYMVFHNAHDDTSFQLGPPVTSARLTSLQNHTVERHSREKSKPKFVKDFKTLFLVS